MTSISDSKLSFAGADTRKPHKTQGAGLLCGLYALAGAFADSINPDITNRDERESQA